MSKSNDGMSRLNLNANLPFPLLTIADVASVLKVSERTVRRLIQAGRLASVSVGRSVRIRAEDLADLTRSR